jgi:hypothetical protein
MMTPAALGLLSMGIQAAPALFQGISGLVQKKKAKEELENLKYPMRPMSSGITAAKDILTQQANMDQMPGQSMVNSQLDQAISSQLGSATRAGMSSQDIMALASQLGEARLGQGMEMGVQAAGMQQQNKAKLAEFLSGTYAQEQQDLYQNNILNQYLMKQQGLSQNLQTGRENINAGINALGTAATTSLPYLAAGKDWGKLSMLLGGEYFGSDDNSTMQDLSSNSSTGSSNSNAFNYSNLGVNSNFSGFLPQSWKRI